MYSPKRRFRLFRDPAFTGGGTPPVGDTTDILTFARDLADTFLTSDVTPTDGGALTVNSQAVGNYEYTTRKSNTTISSFTAADWFTSTQDTTSSWIIVNGNLTINSGQTFIPSVRKLFTVLYISGNLVCNGSISMSARGANHSGTGTSGGYTAPVDIRIGTGTFGAVTNPQIPSAGGNGAAGTSTDNAVSSGSAGTSGGSGGGGAGGKFSGTARSGNGSAGTCFSGGTGGGGVISSNTPNNGGDGESNGGKGGDSVGTASGGGTGNPGGTKGGINGLNGNSGTGGTLIIIVEGTLSGSGTIVANGVAGIRPPGAPAGGGSGGGSVTVIYGTDSSSITPTATGGAGNFSGNGGNGTARKLAIGSN
jgi:hypothetical protein